MNLKPFYSIVNEIYPFCGVAETQKQTGLSNRQIRYIAQKIGIEVDRTIRNNNISLEKLKNHKKPEEFNVNHEDFLNVNCPEKAYVLGLLWADGTLRNVKNDTSVRFGTTVPDDEYFYKQFQKTGEWKVYKTYRNKKNKNWKIAVQFYTSNRFLVEKLISLGFTKRIDGFDAILKLIPEQYRRFWLLGFIDGDGCFHKRKNNNSGMFILTSGYGQDWSAIEFILKQLNVKYYIVNRMQKTGRNSALTVNKKRDIKAIGDFLYTTDLGLPRKREIYNKIVQ